MLWLMRWAPPRVQPARAGRVPRPHRALFELRPGVAQQVARADGAAAAAARAVARRRRAEATASWPASCARRASPARRAPARNIWAGASTPSGSMSRRAARCRAALPALPGGGAVSTHWQHDLILPYEALPTIESLQPAGSRRWLNYRGRPNLWARLAARAGGARSSSTAMWAPSPWSPRSVDPRSVRRGGRGRSVYGRAGPPT